jgi:excisionase family DNA binding protein
MTAQLSLDDLSTPRGLTRAELMTAIEVAELLDVPVSTVREWGRKGTLPRVKLGRHVRFIRSHVEAAILNVDGVVVGAAGLDAGGNVCRCVTSAEAWAAVTA